MKKYLIVLALLFLAVSTANADSFKIKSFYAGSTLYGNNANFATGAWFSQERSYLLNHDNFDGRASGITFESITDITTITPETLSDADILVIVAPYTNTAGSAISSNQAGYIKNYVDNGGSLIFIGDGGGGAVSTSNTVANKFGVSYIDGLVSGTLVNMSSFLITGSFGVQTNFSFSSNAVSVISNLGPDAEAIAKVSTHTAIAKIDSDGISGNVVFGIDMFVIDGAADSASAPPRLGNIFEYAALGSGLDHSVIPEPLSIVLLAMGALRLITRFEK